MAHWLEPLSRIVNSDSGDLRALALSVGANPRTYYVNQDLSCCDLKGQDLSGMDLTGTNMSASNMDEKTVVDSHFDPRFKMEREYIPIRFSLELAALILAFSEENNYAYKAWAFKNLIERGLRRIRRGPDLYIKFILENSDYLNLVTFNKKIYARYTIQVYRDLQEQSHYFSKNYSIDNNVYPFIILIGILSSRMPNIEEKDYSLIKPLSIFERAHHFMEELEKGRR